MLKQLQAASGALFALFVAVHLFNTWLASIGPAAYDGVQSALRAIYQFPPVEVLLLAALAVHIVVGLMRIFGEPKRTLTPRARWHRYAGVFLLVFIVGHILAVRGPSWFYDVYPGFAGLSFSIHFAPWYFYPYYFLLGLAGFYHAANGLSIALPRLGMTGAWPPHVVVRGTMLAAVLTLLALLGLEGVWLDVGDPYDNDFARLAAELTGVEL